MSTNTPASEPSFGPVRRGVVRVADALFVALLIAMLLLGTVLVLLQLGGLVTHNPDFIVGVAATLGPPTYAVAAAFGILTLFVSLAHGWKPSD